MSKPILWLASWYPNRNDPFDGDFIERHALAVSRFEKIILLFITKDEKLPNNSFEIEKTVEGNLTIYKAYYGKSGWGGLLERLLSLKKYLQIQNELYRRIISESGTPSIVHVQVAMKAGLLARQLKKSIKIPFVVSEHWSGYYPEIVPNIYTSNWLIKRLNKKILVEADLFLPVSDSLGKIVNQYFAAIQYQVVPDAVDTSLFFYKPSINKKFRFIHPSSLIQIKNPEGILNACKIVKEKGYDFELLMLGGNNEKMISLSSLHGLQGHVIFEAVVPYTEVAKKMQESSALLMFSRFETLSCVVLEALCCGLPVVSSRVGGIPEIIDNENGILVDSENIAGLAEAMIQMIEGYAVYNQQHIAEKASALFNYNVVGKQYASIYKRVMELNQ